MAVTEKGAKEKILLTQFFSFFLNILNLICRSEAEIRSEMGAEFSLGPGEGPGLMLFSINACIENLILWRFWCMRLYTDEVDLHSCPILMFSYFQPIPISY